MWRHASMQRRRASWQGQPKVPRRERLSDCQRIAAARPYLRGGKQLAPRDLSPRVFFSGAVQTKTRGPGLCAPPPSYPASTPRAPPHDTPYHILPPPTTSYHILTEPTTT